jgi:ribosomal protein L37AE/L43A
MIKAPWTDKQVKALVLRQNQSMMHPYTCPKCSNDLTPTRIGWLCNNCRQIVQTWAHNEDAQDESLINRIKKLHRWIKRYREIIKKQNAIIKEINKRKLTEQGRRRWPRSPK